MLLHWQFLAHPKTVNDATIYSILLLTPDKAIEIKCVLKLIFTICVDIQMQLLDTSYLTICNDKVNIVTLERTNDVVFWLFEPDQLRIFFLANVIFDLLIYVKSIIAGRVFMVLTSSPANFLKFSACSSRFA